MKLTFVDYSVGPKSATNFTKEHTKVHVHFNKEKTGLFIHRIDWEWQTGEERDTGDKKWMHIREGPTGRKTNTEH